MKKILVLLIIALCISNAYGQSKSKLAIVPPVGSVEQDIKDALFDALLEGASKSGKYTLVDRNGAYQQALEKVDQKSGTLDDKQVTEFGRAIKADFVCYASVRKIGSNYRISYTMLGVASSGTSSVNSKSTTNGDNDLLAVLDDIAEDVFGVKAAAERTRIAQARVDDQRQKEDLRNNPSKYCSGVAEVETKDKGPFTGGKAIDNLEKECPRGWKLPDEAQMQCLIKNEICSGNRIYWTSNRHEESGRMQRQNPALPNVINNCKYTHSYRSYVGASSGSFHYKSDFGNQSWSDYMNSAPSAYIRCVRVSP